MSNLLHPNPIKLWHAGGDALKVVPGLKKRLLYGFALNLVLYVVVAALAITGYYRFVHNPLLDWINKHTPLWLATASSVLLLLLLLAVCLLVLFFSLRVSIKLMALWHEDLVERLVTHVRNLPDEPFSFRVFLQGLGHTLLDISVELGIALCLFFVGLIPLVGPVLVFLGTSHLLGKTVMEPYRCVMRSLGHKVDAGQNRPLATIQLGWAHMLLVLVPLLGWLVMPVSLTYQVIGLAWLHEKTELTPEDP